MEKVTELVKKMLLQEAELVKKMLFQEVRQADTRTDGNENLLINNGYNLSQLLMISRMNLPQQG